MIILDLDSSAYNGHFGCTCYHPLFCFNQFGDLERSLLRRGNAHSAEGWKTVLAPVLARYRGRRLRRYFRADAAFAMPEIYTFLEAEGFKYAIRLPANRVLQQRIGHLLRRPVGRPAKDVRRTYASFRYQAKSWPKPRRVGAKVEWHPGELYPRVGFIVTNLARPPERVVAFYNGRGTAEQWIKEGKNALIWRRLSCRGFDANAVRLAAAHARLHPRQLHADPGAAAGGEAVVTDDAARQARQDRRQGGAPRPVRDLPARRGGRAENAVRRDPGADRATATRTGADMTRGRGDIDQHGQCTAREMRVEGSREFSSRRLSAHSTSFGQRSPPTPSENRSGIERRQAREYGY